MSKKIVFKFCGGCNPSIDRLELRKKLVQEMTQFGWEIVRNGDDKGDLLIIINGCQTACMQNGQETHHFQEIIIAGESVNTCPTKEEDICKTILDIIGK